MSSKKQKIITRFAPSPTGFLHIGGARTALFCYYYAKRFGGDFRLRIEDTDKERSTEQAKQAILDGLEWLGLKHDDDIVYQSQNIERHKRVVQKLVASGHAYKCYLSEEEIKQERELSRAEGRAFRSKWRDGGDPPENADSVTRFKAIRDINRFVWEVEADNTDFVIRFKVPEGETIINDHVQGQVKWDNKDFDDLVLLRSDGSPVYMLAVVVDDHDMGVTHIIRGDDHLVNAGRQKLIYQALGWNVPEFAHIPLIHGPDGKKLSKRHGALGIEAYKDDGYIPAGLRNYLARLGWSHGDMEIFDDGEIIEIFDLSDINKAPARLDFDKMAFVNGQHIQKSKTSALFETGKDFFEKANNGKLDNKQKKRLIAAIPHAKTRAKTLKELAEKTRYATQNRPLEFSGKAKKPLKAEAEKYIRDLQSQLEKVKDSDWSSDEIFKILQGYCEQNEIGFGKIGAPLRACLTAGHASPDLSVVMEVLGKQECLMRIKDCLDRFYNN